MMISPKFDIEITNDLLMKVTSDQLPLIRNFMPENNKKCSTAFTLV